MKTNNIQFEYYDLKQCTFSQPHTQHIIPDRNIMTQNDRTTAYTANTLNKHTDLEFNVHT